MNKLITLIFLFLLVSATAQPQQLTQTVRGTVLDADSKLPLIGVTIVVANNPQKGATTNINGDFTLTNVPIGRVTLLLSYIGYESKTLPDIEVNSGKEKILAVTLQESLVNLNEVVIKSTQNKGESLNEMSLISTRSVSAEETKRYAGGFNDPSKILSNYAGVTASQNGQNDIIVRGNSPKYVQWRLDGVEIINPTHFADQNSVKGGISALNNSLLGTSDFSTGAFAPEYGNALSGVYDVKLRTGNNKKLETTLGIGIQGTDITLEGPLKKGYGGSFLINYRYSTISLLNTIGLIKLDGVLNYQDGAFKLMLPTRKAGVFSFFGIGGLSGASVKAVKADAIATQSNGTLTADITEDYTKSNYLSTYGMNHTLNLTQRSFLKTTLSYSNNGIADDVYKVKTTKIVDGQGTYMGDSVGKGVLDYQSKLAKLSYRGAVTYTHKLDAKNTFEVGTKYSILGFEYKQSNVLPGSTSMFTLTDFNQHMTTLQNFISWKHRLNERVTLVGGFHNMNVLYNQKSTLEPRLAVTWKLNSSSSFNAGYGKHSTMESVHNYFAKVKAADGTVSEPNKNLDLLKADHFVLGYEKRFGDFTRVKLEAYYQNLYNLPVENKDTSYYSTINEGTTFRYVELVNKGTGKNYGVELTVERFFHRNYYYLVSASLYDSKYKTLEGVERNTQYNGNYLLNVLVGKEYPHLGVHKNQTLNVNTKLFFAGGQRYIPLLRDAQGNVAVDPASNKFWDYKKAYDKKFDDLYQIAVSISYKWNKPKVTHELFINLDNLTNAKGRLSEFYDETKPGKVGYVTQFGLFPNIMYRLYL